MRLGEAEAALANAGPRDQAPQRLLAAIREAQAQGGMERAGYGAARALADWSFAHNRYDIARPAWRAAADLSAGADKPPLARGQALYAEAASIVIVSSEGSRPHLSNDDARNALLDLREALFLIFPLTRNSDPAAALTEADISYAQARAWQALIRIKFNDARRDLPRLPPPAQSMSAPSSASLPPCAVSLDHQPLPEYPIDALNQFGVGVVVVWIDFAPDGHSARLRLAAGVGAPSFLNATEQVLAQWNATQARSPACTFVTPYVTTVNFQTH
jgi:hypothetical protein